MTNPRPLTHDEKKASEAAFRGLPFDPKWSQAAKTVYDGILATLEKSTASPVITDPPSGSSEESRDLVPLNQEDIPVIAEESDETAVEFVDEQSVQQIHSRREAIEAGYLMDVSEEAKNIGLELAVGMTKPLWNRGICPSADLSEEELHHRVRDVLLAVRLRLAGLESPAAFVEVPVLLSFEPDPTPQLFLIYALFHKDPLEADSLLLLHPGEVSLAKQSFSEN
ncbi:MAG: hypothetical protein MRJ96_04310 [Nitrospirales bacterium]|nr:hypothetical protein [Nitrospira sp.]MDR4500664.1 hypothetical protein [Nitrospirales bacterium]